jgi:molybdopterin/thiamine biosynthesis adenylyltransferase
MRQTRKIKVIGSGGIGSHLLEPLVRYLSYKEDYCEVTVFDGDDFEERNRERQRFAECANKAEETVRDLKVKFPKVHLRAKKEYITESNIITSIRENDVVFLCVDNHATRKLVSERCSELDEVLLISGGNDFTDGDVLVYQRQRGRDLTPPLTALPEIAKPNDKNPGNFTDEERLGCQREAENNPQLLFMNLDIASCMLGCYYASEQGRLKFKRVFSDILTQARRVVR